MKKTGEKMKQNINPAFATVKLKTNIAERFRNYSQKIASSHSEAMELILDFFEQNKISPAEDLGPNMKSLESSLKKRINAVVAIIRDIEKTQTKPTLAMLHLLFQESQPKKEIVLEKKKSQNSSLSFNSHELWVKKTNDLQNRLYNSKKYSYVLLEKVKVSRTSFGKVQLRLMMSIQELEEYKQKIRNL